MSQSINLSLDTTKSDIQNPKVILRQGDGNYQTLRITITSNGEPTNLSDKDVVFMGTTSSNHKIIDSNINKVDAINGVVDYCPPKQWGQDMGDFNNAYFKISNGDSVVSTASFKVSVQEAVDLTAQEAGAYISVVDGIVATARKEISEQLDDVKKRTDNATNMVNQATDNLTKQVQQSVTDLTNKVQQSNDDITSKVKQSNDDITNKYNDANAKADEINKKINDGNLAKVNDTNNFNSNQNFNNDLDVQGKLSAHQLMYALNGVAVNNGGIRVVGTTDLTGDTKAQKIDAFGALLAHDNFAVGGSSIVQKLDVNDDFFTHKGATLASVGIDGYADLRGNTHLQSVDIYGAQANHAITRGIVEHVDFYANGLHVDLYKYGQIIQCVLSGTPMYISPAYNNFGGFNVPAGYRPVGETSIPVEQGFENKLLTVFPDGFGRVMARDIGQSNVQGGATWMTYEW